MEIWKSVLGYENYYKVSNLGRIKNTLTGKILNPCVSKNGYKHLTLCYKGRRDVMVHRLVANAFVDNINGFPVVNHVDENKLNNSAENLEWCTTQYNVTYGNMKFLRNTKVVQCNLQGEPLRIWNSLKEVEEELNIKYQLISRCCRGHRRSTHGFVWKYVNDSKEGVA